MRGKGERNKEIKGVKECKVKVIGDDEKRKKEQEEVRRVTILHILDYEVTL